MPSRRCPRNGKRPLSGPIRPPGGGLGAKLFEVSLYPRIRGDRPCGRWRWLCARPITSDLGKIVGRPYAIVNGSR